MGSWGHPPAVDRGQGLGAGEAQLATSTGWSLDFQLPMKPLGRDWQDFVQPVASVFDVRFSSKHLNALPSWRVHFSYGAFTSHRCLFYARPYKFHSRLEENRLF